LNGGAKRFDGAVGLFLPLKLAVEAKRTGGVKWTVVIENGD
jgi:hypothetical protein